MKATPLTLTKFAPVIVTLLPIAPLAGANPLMTGVVVTVNRPALWAVPFGVRTVILSVVALAGTVAVMRVAEFTVKVEAAAPKLTLVAPVRLAPEIVTEVPTLPAVGVKLLIAGALVTVKAPELVAEPVGVVTEIGPVRAPAGTVATSCVLALTTNPAALTPPNLSAARVIAPVPRPTGSARAERMPSRRRLRCLELRMV